MQSVSRQAAGSRPVYIPIFNVLFEAVFDTLADRWLRSRSPHRLQANTATSLFGSARSVA